MDQRILSVAKADKLNGPMRRSPCTASADEVAAHRIAGLSTCRCLPETTIRLLFFQSNIRGKFQQTYGDILTAGFAALKLDVPNFALLNRREALAVIQEFQAKANTSSSTAARRCLPLLTEGLRDLDSKYIPANWI